MEFVELVSFVVCFLYISRPKNTIFSIGPYFFPWCAGRGSPSLLTTRMCDRNLHACWWANHCLYKAGERITAYIALRSTNFKTTTCSVVLHLYFHHNGCCSCVVANRVEMIYLKSNHFRDLPLIGLWALVSGIRNKFHICLQSGRCTQFLFWRHSEKKNGWVFLLNISCSLLEPHFLEFSKWILIFVQGDGPCSWFFGFPYFLVLDCYFFSV